MRRPTHRRGGQSGGGNGRRNGGSHQNNTGGGAATGGRPGETPSAKEDFAPETQKGAEPENSGAGTVAPEGQPQSGLFLRKLQEAPPGRRQGQGTRKDTGYSREQIEQFSASTRR